MKYFLAFGLSASLYAQGALTADLRPAPPQPKKTVQTEVLRYSVNWPTGLNLGEGQLASTHTKSSDGESWDFSLNLGAAIPGFPVQETITSKAGGGYCSTELTKNSVRGKKITKETTTFDSTKMTATRTTLNGGGKSEVSIPACAKDALAYVFYLRHELAQGHVPLAQKVYYGASYETRVQFMGAQSVRVGGAQADTDRIAVTIKGPASSTTFDIFFARDAVRTPLLVQVPLTMGKFNLELIR